MAQICFDPSTFYLVMIVGFGTIIYALYQQKIEPARHRRRHEPGIELGPGRLERMMHPLVPPLRRGPFSYPVIGVPVNTPTRGEYGSFQQIGFLHNENDPDQAMPLIGRRIHSNQYEYYTFHHNNPQIKIPIKLQGNKEINDGDNISVYGYTAPLQAKIYDYDVPRYIPY